MTKMGLGLTNLRAVGKVLQRTKTLFRKGGEVKRHQLTHQEQQDPHLQHPKQLKGQVKPLKIQRQQRLQQKFVNMLKKGTSKKAKPQRAAGPLAHLSAELKHRLAEQVRRSSPNYELWLREWFFGPTSRAGAEYLLLGNARNQPGDFLLCEGRGARKREFILSVLIAVQGDEKGSASGGRIVKHFRVRPFLGYRISSLCAFNSLQDLIDYYSAEEREGDLRLRRPCAMPRTREYALL
jgi:hypothetical protein